VTTSDIHSDATDVDLPAGTGQCCGSCSSTDTATTAPTSGQPEQSTAMATTTYTVTGMTCGHCVHAVSSEIGKLPGVSDVQVDLPTGAVTVTSAAPLAQAQVADAVQQAGCELSNAGSGPGTEGDRVG